MSNSTTKTLKFLYTFEIPKQYEDKVTEIKEENGEKIEISKIVKKVKKVKLAILEPKRKLYEVGEIFHAKQVAEYFKQNLMPRSLVAKRYLNDGGPLSDPEKQRIEELKKTAGELQQQLFLIEANDDESIKKRNNIILKINELNTELNSIQNSFYEIFENTIETKARNKTIEWWVLNLAYIQDTEKSDDFNPIFGNGTYDEKLIKYDELEENNDLFYKECINKSSYLITFWFTSGVKLTEQEFKGIDKLYSESFSDYKVEEEKLVKVEDKSDKKLDEKSEEKI